MILALLRLHLGFKFRGSVTIAAVITIIMDVSMSDPLLPPPPHPRCPPLRYRCSIVVCCYSCYVVFAVSDCYCDAPPSHDCCYSGSCVVFLATAVVIVDFCVS